MDSVILKDIYVWSRLGILGGSMEILGSIHHHVLYESAVSESTTPAHQAATLLGQQTSSSDVQSLQVRRQCVGNGSMLMLAIALLLTNPQPSQAAPGLLLRLGQQGQDVVYIQSRLKTLGFFTADTTGYFGPVTEAAVIQFQRVNNLMVDGVVGPQTLTALNLGQPTTQPAVYYQVANTNASTVTAPVVTTPVVTTPVVTSPAVNTAVATPVIAPVVTTEPSPTIIVSVPAATISRGSIGDELFTGSRGPIVSEVQDLLQKRGLYVGPVTGYYGLLTTKAVQDFQRSVGLEPSGVTGRRTLELLRE